MRRVILNSRDADRHSRKTFAGMRRVWSPFAIAVGRVTITRQIYEYTYDGPERAVRQALRRTSLQVLGA